MADLDTAAEPGAAEEPSIADTLSAAFDAAQAGPETPEAAPAAGAAADPLQPRTADGRYTNKPAEAAPAAPAGAKPEITAAPTTEQPSAPARASAPPVSWSAEAKDLWATLPASLQAEIAKRDLEVTRGFTEKGEEAKRAADIFAALEPVRSDLRVRGLSEAQYIGQVAQADLELRTNFSQAIRSVAALYGQDLDKLFAPQPGATAQPNGEQPPASSADPTVAALQRDVAAWKAEKEAQQQAEARRQEADLLRQIGEFRDAKDGSGQPLYPYFDQVRAHMSAIMQAEGHGDLQKAYTAAVWAHPGIRASLQAQEKAEAERVRLAEAGKRATEAKRSASASVSTRGTPNGSPATPPSIRETLSEAFDAATAA